MKKRIISILAAAVIACGAFSAPVQEIAGSAAAVAQAAASVASPKPDKVSGTYISKGTLKVSFSSKTSGAKIYTSVNGASYKLTTKAITLSKNSTVKAYAVKDGVKSAVVTYKYNLSPKVTVSLKEGSYDAAQKVYLKTSVSGVKFYYTLDGSKPTTSSARYTEDGITIAKTATLRVLAVKSNWKSRIINKSYIITAPAVSILDDYESKWGYSTLSDAQKLGYAALFESAKNHTDYADMSDLGLTVSDVDKMYWAFDYDNPQFFWMGNGYYYTYTRSGRLLGVEIMYSRTKSQAEALQPQFDKAAQAIIDEALLYEDTFDRIKALHDALINMTTYTTSGSDAKSEADGPLLNGKALCEGYSKAFMYLCQSIGIPCVCVAGTSSSESHMWNMVCADGVWYHMDVTWDDPVSTKPILRYDYFCISDKKLLADHTIENLFPVPSAPYTYNG